MVYKFGNVLVFNKLRLLLIICRAIHHRQIWHELFWWGCCLTDISILAESGNPYELYLRSSRFIGDIVLNDLILLCIGIFLSKKCEMEDLEFSIAVKQLNCANVKISSKFRLTFPCHDEMTVFHNSKKWF